MIMGFFTLSIVISLKVIFKAWLGSDAAYDLILTPLVVLNNVQLVTTIPLTSSSFLYLPRLPTLVEVQSKTEKK
jgi:hypothetical protein